MKSYLATVTTAATEIPPRAAAAAGRAILTRAGNVDRQGATGQFLAVQRVNGLLGFLRGGHGNEGETPGTAGGPVHHEVGFDDCAVSREGVLQVVFSDVE